uniref:Uncharacterized protein n=1 Tax=Cacopsylla melanoneura TaxID=428564 RepID=A0A8D8T4C2_9HEMI
MNQQCSAYPKEQKYPPQTGGQTQPPPGYQDPPPAYNENYTTPHRNPTHDRPPVENSSFPPIPAYSSYPCQSAIPTHNNPQVGLGIPAQQPIPTHSNPPQPGWAVGYNPAQQAGYPPTQPNSSITGGVLPLDNPTREIVIARQSSSKASTITIIVLIIIFILSIHYCIKMSQDLKQEETTQRTHHDYDGHYKRPRWSSS